jgi:hypothetical protein
VEEAPVDETEDEAGVAAPRARMKAKSGIERNKTHKKFKTKPRPSTADDKACRIADVQGQVG